MKITKNWVINKYSYNSSNLLIGEMMEVFDVNASQYNGEVIMSTYEGFISLSNPNHFWSKPVDLIGRKLLQGEFVALIQE